MINEIKTSLAGVTAFKLTGRYRSALPCVLCAEGNTTDFADQNAGDAVQLSSVKEYFSSKNEKHSHS